MATEFSVEIAESNGWCGRTRRKPVFWLIGRTGKLAWLVFLRGRGYRCVAVPYNRRLISTRITKAS